MDRDTLNLLAGLAHDLRTPLCAIAGHSSLLKMGLHGPLSPAQAESIRRIDDNQKQLTALLGDFLNYAEAASGMVKMTLAPCAIRPLVAQAVTAAHAESRARGVRVDYDGDCSPDVAGAEVREPAPWIARVDERVTRIVITNMLEDALAHGEGDSVIRVSVDDTSELLHVIVDSIGSPIREEVVDLLFTPYVRDESGRSVGESNHSLLLPRARALARAMGADVRAVPCDMRRILQFSVSRFANQRPVAG